MFGPDDVGFFDEMITGFLDGTMDDNQWLVVEHDSTVVAGAYYAPEPFSDRTWNLYFVAVAPTRHGHGTHPRIQRSGLGGVLRRLTPARHGNRRSVHPERLFAP